MIRRFIILLSALVFIVSVSLSAEDALIPRRIRIVDPAGNAAPLLSSVLYARLALQSPLVVSSDDELPHNTIILESDDTITITLEDRNGVLDLREYPVDIGNDPVAAAEAFDELSTDWAQYLGLVEPDIAEEQEVRREALAAEVSFEEQLNTPFQATLWLPVAARQSIVTDGENRKNRWIWAWPLRADFAWFFTENLGLTGSFRFEYGNHLSFASDVNNESVDSTVLMLMPGVGIQVRTLGKISAEFGISVFFGAVKITADEISDKPNLAVGESTWVFYPVLSFEPSIVWSPTKSWSVKARIIELQLGLPGMGGSNDAGYGTAQNTLVLNYLQFGAAYRW